MKKFLVLIFLLPMTLATTTPLEQTCVTTKGGYFAAVTEEIFDEAMDYAAKKDLAALQKLFDAKKVFTLKPGVQVYVKPVGFLSGKVKIRTAGTTIWFWTVQEAVNC